MSSLRRSQPSHRRDGQGVPGDLRRRAPRRDRPGRRGLADLAAARPASPSARRWCARSASCTPSAREQLAEIIVREMGKPIEQALVRSTSPATIYGFYADNAEGLMADEPIELLGGDGTALIRRSPFGVAARDHALELPLLPGGPLRRAEPGDRQHDPAQARAAVPRIGRGDRSRSSTTPASPRAPTRTSTRPTSRSSG